MKKIALLVFLSACVGTPAQGFAPEPAPGSVTAKDPVPVVAVGASLAPMTTPQLDGNKFRALTLQFGGSLDIERPSPGQAWTGKAELCGVSATASGGTAAEAEANVLIELVTAVEVRMGDLQIAWTAISTP